jgi:hypothetical protein
MDPTELAASDAKRVNEPLAVELVISCFQESFAGKSNQRLTWLEWTPFNQKQRSAQSWTSAPSLCHPCQPFCKQEEEAE